jgi:glycine oxidase
VELPTLLNNLPCVRDRQGAFGLRNVILVMVIDGCNCKYNTLMSQHPDVLIIGGGVIGLTTAYFLAKEGMRVQVIDKGELGAEASWAGAGIIPPGNPDAAVGSYDRLRAISSASFPSFSDELCEHTGIDNGYRVCGGLEFLDNEAETIAAWRAEQVPFEKVDAKWFAKNEPRIRPLPSPAYHLPGMAQVRNPWHVRALIDACLLAHVELTPRMPLAGLESSGERITGAAMESGGVLRAGQYLVAAGAWSDSFLKAFGIQTGIHPVRGQIVLLKTDAPLLRRIVFVGKDYLVPREDGHLLIGSTEEPEAGFVKRTTAEAVAHLIGFGAGIVSGIREAEMVKAWAGLRPGSRDGLPSMGRVGSMSNLFVASGHFRAGIQLSPGTAMAMTALLKGSPPSIPLDDFRADRETSAPFRPAFRS